MPTPHTPGSVADVPVNIAPPNWQCPHCLTKYREDLEAATACAQAGPPPDVTEGTPVLVLTGHSTGSRDTAPVFGLTEVGPVKPLTVDGNRQHSRDVVVAGKAIGSDRLATAAQAGDGLLVLADTRRRHPDAQLAQPDLSSFGTLTELFLGKNTYGDYRNTGVTVWAEPARPYGRTDLVWWRAPDTEQRAALNIVTGGLLDKVAETDEAELLTRIRAGYAPRRVGHQLGQRPADLAGPASGLMVADAHGAPNHIWALRWLTAHLEEVTAWQVRILRAWAAGDGGPIPGGTSLRISDTLPKNPGKRRLAVMEPYGDNYLTVRDTVVAQLTIDAPVNPVPDLGDVETTVRATCEGN